MSDYVLFGAHSKYNLNVSVFDVECKLLLVLRKFPEEHSRLCKKRTLEHAEAICEALCLAPFGDAAAEREPAAKPAPGWLDAITQFQAYELLHALCAMWNRLEFDLDALETLLDGLQLSIAPLIFKPHPEQRMDGRFPSQRVAVDQTPQEQQAGAPLLFRPSAEFVSDVASMFAAMWRGVHVAEVLSGAANEDLAQQSEPVRCLDLCPRPRAQAAPCLFFAGSRGAGAAPVWEGYRAREADSLLPLWSTDQLSNSNQAGFYDKLRGTLCQFNQRPGERDRHTRANSNTPAKDPVGVLEHCRTPAQLDLFFSSFKVRTMDVTGLVDSSPCFQVRGNGADAQGTGRLRRPLARLLPGKDIRLLLGSRDQQQVLLVEQRPGDGKGFLRLV